MGYFNAKKLDDIRNTVRHNRLQMQPFLEFYERCMRQFVGPYYGSAGDTGMDRQSVNLLDFGTRTLVNAIVPLNPRCNITSKYRSRKPAAAKFKQGGNQLFEEIDLGATFEMGGQAAMFGPSMIKVGIHHAGTAEYGGFSHDITRPFADYVSADDTIMDFSAKRWDHQTMVGNRWTCDYEMVMEGGLFKHTDRLKPSRSPRFDHQGNAQVRSLQRSMDGYFEAYRPQADLIDLWLPMEGKNGVIITVPDVDGDWGDHPLREVDWEGVEDGPYFPIMLQPVADNIIPKSPAHQMIDLHELMNVLYNKLSRQALRQKTHPTAGRGNDDDAKELNDKGDGEWVLLNDAAGAREISWGGPNQMNLAFFMSGMNLFYEINGGLNSVAGLGPAADTLGQERMVHQAATGAVREYSKRMQKCVKKVMQALLAYEWSDPTRERKIALHGGRVEAWWGPADRVGDMLAFDMDLEPYSLTDMTPADRLQILEHIAERAMGFAPLMEQQGISLKVEGLLRKMGEYSGCNDIDDILTFAAPAMQELQPPTGGDGQAGQRMPAQTKRTYERISRPGAAQQNGGFSQDLIASLAGGQNPMGAMMRQGAA